MRKPQHQRILTGFFYIFVGYCLLGGFFSATNNARTLISPKASLPLALAGLAVWFFIELSLRESPILWVSLKGEPARIKGFGIRRRLGIFGGILLLLVPFVVDKARRDRQESQSYEEYGRIYQFRADGEGSGMSESAPQDDDDSKGKLLAQDDDRSKSKLETHKDGATKTNRRTVDGTLRKELIASIHGDTEAVEGTILYGIERARLDNLNQYPGIWLTSLREHGAKVFRYSDAKEMVDMALAQLGKGQLIQELNLYGYGKSGFFTVGNGQSPDFRDLTYITPDNLTKEEWRNLLEPFKGRFLHGAKVNLIGCYVGAGEKGANLLYQLSKILDVTVSAPVGTVWAAKQYLGSWQVADPILNAPPPPKLAESERTFE